MGSEATKTTAGLIGLAVGTVALAWAGTTGRDGLALLLYAALFLPYAATLVGLKDLEGARVLLVGGAALLLRGLLLPLDPIFSDDLYRYVWDGRVGLSGINPFLHAPASEALAHLRDPVIWENVNHPEVPTIYPPGAQYLFELNALLGGGVVGMKGLFVVVEAACVALCGWLIWRADDASIFGRAPAVMLAVYALNPLVFVEVAWSGHVDVVAWSLLAVGLVAWRCRPDPTGTLAAGAAVGASVAVKFLGLMVLPLLLFAHSARAEPRRPLGSRIAAVAVVLAVFGLSYLPYAGAGGDLFSGFGTYAESWRSNDGAYRAVHRLSASTLEAWAPPEATDAGEQPLFELEGLNPYYERLGWTKQWQGETLPDTTYTAGELAAIVGKATALVVLGLALLWCLIVGRSPVAGLVLLLLTLYAFAPVVHPWYVAWLVPLAALTRSKAPLAFSFTVLLAYLAWLSSRTGGPWHVPTWAVVVEYGAVAAVFLAERVYLSGQKTI